MSHIVVIGAGFVGLSTARRLQKRLPRDTKITLLDSKDQFLFTPRLIDVLQNPRYPRAYVRADLREIALRDGFTFIQGHVTAVDRNTRAVTYTVPTSKTRTETLIFDILVLCQGAKPCFYAIPGTHEYALPLKSEEDVRHVHDHVERVLEEAAHSASPETRQRLLSFVTVGAGPSGVEAICALKLMVEARSKERYPKLIEHLSWTLLQAGPEILPGFPATLVAHTRRLLAAQGITVRTGAAVSAISLGSLTTAQGILETGCVLWTAGIEPSVIDLAPKIHTDRAGYLPVDSTLKIAPNIFGAGDVVLYREGNMIIPKNAQTAVQMSKTLSENVLRTLAHQPLIPFYYASRGNILTMGKSGFLDLKFFSIHSRFAPFIRNLLYRFRLWQIIKG